MKRRDLPPKSPRICEHFTRSIVPFPHCAMRSSRSDVASSALREAQASSIDQAQSHDRRRRWRRSCPYQNSAQRRFERPLRSRFLPRRPSRPVPIQEFAPQALRKKLLKSLYSPAESSNVACTSKCVLIHVVQQKGYPYMRPAHILGTRSGTSSGELGPGKSHSVIREAWPNGPVVEDYTNSPGSGSDRAEYRSLTVFVFSSEGKLEAWLFDNESPLPLHLTGSYSESMLDLTGRSRDKEISLLWALSAEFISTKMLIDGDVVMTETLLSSC